MPISYRKGVHPDCGKIVKIHKDIVMTPFYTEKFCDELVKICKFYNNKFSPHIFYINKFDNKDLSDTSPWDTLNFSRIGLFLFEDFCVQYKKHICPVVEKHFLPETIPGWFSPMIIKYSRPGQHVTLHNDTSLLTLNVRLNTDYEGCDVEFPRQKWNNKKLPKGWCMIWPSRVTHPHRATPLKKGTKYTLSSWTHPIAWDPRQMGGSIIRNES